MCKVPGSWECKVPVSWGNQGEVPVSGLSGEFGSTCVVEGPNTWEASGGHGPGNVRVGWRIMTEGLVAWGDWLVQITSATGLVTFSGSTPGLVARISDDPRTLRNVTSESVDISSVETSVTGHWISGTLPKLLRQQQLRGLEGRDWI